MDKDIRTKLEEANEKNYPRVRQEMLAMLSIEERAERYGMESANLLCSNWSEEQRKKQAKIYAKVYANIATEQKAIDEAEQTEEMRKLNEEWKENLAECKRQRDAYYDELTRLRQERVKMIDKACEQEPYAMYVLAMNHVYVEHLDNEELVQFKNSCYNDYLDALREMHRRRIESE